MSPLRLSLPFISLGAALALSSCDKNDPGGDLGDFGQPSGADRSEAAVASRPIAIGDKLEVFVEEDPTFNDVYLVREGGDIIVPRLGRIQMAGISVKAAEARIVSSLKRGHIADPTVFVDRLLDERANRVIQETVRVFVTGKVNSAGMHRIPIEPGQVLGAYEALLISGGMSKFGDDRTSHILRSGEGGRRVKIPLDIRGINQGTAADPPVVEGDIIVVPEKVWGI